MASSSIHIQYCGCWGSYEKHAQKLFEAINKEFGEGAVAMTATKDSGKTDNFEITLLSTGELIHSHQGGDGKCSSDEEKEALFSRLRADMAKNA